MAITGYEVDQVKRYCPADPRQHVGGQVTHAGGEQVESGGRRGLGGFACYPDCSKGDQSVSKNPKLVIYRWMVFASLFRITMSGFSVVPQSSGGIEK